MHEQPVQNCFANIFVGRWKMEAEKVQQKDESLEDKPVCKCLPSLDFPFLTILLLFVTGKYANLKICIKILFKLKIPFPVTFSTLIYATIYKGPEMNSDVDTFTSTIVYSRSQDQTVFTSH